MPDSKGFGIFYARNAGGKTDKPAAGGVPGKIFSRTLEKLPGTGYFSVSMN